MNKIIILLVCVVLLFASGSTVHRGGSQTYQAVACGDYLVIVDTRTSEYRTVKIDSLKRGYLYTKDEYRINY